MITRVASIVIAIGLLAIVLYVHNLNKMVNEEDSKNKEEKDIIESTEKEHLELSFLKDNYEKYDITQV